MRRIAFLIAPAALLATVSLIPPALGQGEGKGDTATFNITKVVDGDGPTGGYVIEYTCDGGDIEGGFGDTLEFDAAGPGSPETQTVEIGDAATCTVTETDANGAVSTTYACDFQDAPPASPGFAEDTEGRVGGCVDDQTVGFTRPFQVGTITVTNTFETDVLPDDDEPDVDPDVVAATPPFTG